MKIAVTLFVLAVASNSALSMTIAEGMAAAAASPSDRATGELTGPFAEVLARQFEATAPIGLTVSVVQRFAKAGCNRYRVELKLPTASDKTPFSMEMNLCGDGEPPADAASTDPGPGMRRVSPEELDRFFAAVRGRRDRTGAASGKEIERRETR